MKRLIVAFTLILAVACGGSTPTQPSPPLSPPAAPPAAPPPAPPAPGPIPSGVDGVVVYMERGCDYFVVYTPKNFSYAVLQYWTGFYPSVDDVLVGNLSSYGFETLFNVTWNREFRVWVEDYLLSDRRAAEIILNKCR